MTSTSIMHKNLAFIGSFVAVLFVFTFAVGAYAAHAATIDTQLDFGSRGQEVTDLQTYLSTNINWYPSGLVTGYFGSLTQGGVQKFQTSEGIVSSGTPASTGYGRVGPTTMAHLNAAMNPGNQQPSAFNTVPVLSTMAIQRNATSATFSWTTNEPTLGQIYWSTNSIQTDEATGPGQTPFISGTLATDGGIRTTVHSITVSNLQPNTMYHYAMRSIDAQGEMSVMLDNTFQTTN